MATKAHCAFCFETLSAHFAKSNALTLDQTEKLWDEYARNTEATECFDSDAEVLDHGILRNMNSPTITRVINTRSSATSSSSSLPSTTSSVAAPSSAATPNSSEGSLSTTRLTGRFPLFVTWNLHRSGHKSLRGCIGTFEAQELEYGLSSYALTSALEDVRFSPIPKSQLAQLSNDVTLLTHFSRPSSDPLGWTLGLHGIRIKFSYHNRQYGATYLPSVAPEQGWSKEETIVSLMKKSGWNGSSSNWRRTWDDGRGELVTYEGKKVELEYNEWRAWRDWVDSRQ